MAGDHAFSPGEIERASGMKCYFLRQIDGLDDDVIATNICDYLGDDARISRGRSTNPQTGRIEHGHIIRAYRNLTMDIITHLKADSERSEASIPRIYVQRFIDKFSTWTPAWVIEHPNPAYKLTTTTTIEQLSWDVSGSKVGIQLFEKSEKHKRQSEFLKTLWGLLDAIIELMQTLRVYINLVLNPVSSGFSEFPNSMRPPCTTMPWTIWPTLVVLWGVCWMFNTRPNTADELQLQLSLQGSEWTPLASSDALFNPPGTPFSMNNGISSYLPLGGFDSLPDSSEWLNDVEFNQILPSKGSDTAFTFSEQHAPPLLNEQFSSNFPSSIDFFGAGTSVEQLSVTASAGKQSTVPLHDETSAVALDTGANTQAGQIASPTQAPTTSQPKQPPQSSDGHMICDHLDCGSKGLIFANMRDWS